MAKRKTGSAGLVISAFVGGAALAGCGAGATCGDGVVEEGGLCYGAETTVPMSAPPFHVAVEDFDSDGDPDLAIPLDEDVVILRNDGTGSFTQETITLGVPLSNGIAAGDLDGDGDPDLVAGESGGNILLPGQALILRNDGEAGFALDAAVPTTNGPFDFALADFDGDGDTDIASSNGSLFTGSFDFLRNEGGVFVNAQSASFNNLFPERIEAVDADGDGDQDVMIQGLTFLGGEMNLLRNNGAALFQLEAGPGQGLGMDAGDLNGDGAPDLVLADSPFSLLDSPPDVLVVHLSNGAEGLSVQEQVLKAKDLRDRQGFPHEVTVGDLDGDGDLDVAMGISVDDKEGNPSGGRLLLFANNGEGKLKKSAEVELSVKPLTLAAADLNGDGVDDILFTSPDVSSLFVVFSEP